MDAPGVKNMNNPVRGGKIGSGPPVRCDSSVADTMKGETLGRKVGAAAEELRKLTVWSKDLRRRRGKVEQTTSP